MSILLDLVHQRWLMEGPRRGEPEHLNFAIFMDAERYRDIRQGDHANALRQHNEIIAGLLPQLCRRQSAAGGSVDDILSAVAEMIQDGSSLVRMRPRSWMIQLSRWRRIQRCSMIPKLQVLPRQQSGTSVRARSEEMAGINEALGS